MKQQNTYLELGRELENMSIHVIPLEMDDFDVAYGIINKLFDIRK